MNYFLPPTELRRPLFVKMSAGIEFTYRKSSAAHVGPTATKCDLCGAHVASELYYFEWVGTTRAALGPRLTPAAACGPCAANAAAWMAWAREKHECDTWLSNVEKLRN
jgi:hypothetical protein